MGIDGFTAKGAKDAKGVSSEIPSEAIGSAIATRIGGEEECGAEGVMKSLELS